MFYVKYLLQHNNYLNLSYHISAFPEEEMKRFQQALQQDGAYNSAGFQYQYEAMEKTNLYPQNPNGYESLQNGKCNVSENAGRIDDDDDEVKPNTLTHFNKKTEHAFNGLHAYISVLTHFMYNTWNTVTSTSCTTHEISSQ